MTKKLISIIIPAYNEEDCVDELSKRLKSLFNVESIYDFEVIVVENGSNDSTWEKLKSISANDSRFKILRLSRNFRMDGGLTAGLDYINGDACVLMTADLQDPPELISDFLRKWEGGWENVYGIVKHRTGTGPIRTLNSKLFYFIAGKLTDGMIPSNASDFRLVDKKVYKSVSQMKERNRFIRGLFAWSGFKSIGIPMDRPERFGGRSKAYTVGVIDLALKGIFAHSYKPLKYISVSGIFLSGITICSFPLLALLWVLNGVPFNGFGTLTFLLLFIFSATSLSLGILAEYLALVYEEVKERPNYIVSEKINFGAFDA